MRIPASIPPHHAIEFLPRPCRTSLRPYHMADDHPLLATDQEVLATAASEVQRFKELSHRAHAGYDVPESIKGGCSIELGHRGLTRLPSELINIIKDDADRLALDRNRLTSLSGLAPRFAECTRLRYLVMRNNSLREFPSSVRLCWDVYRFRAPRADENIDIIGSHD